MIVLAIFCVGALSRVYEVDILAIEVGEQRTWLSTQADSALSLWA